MSKSYAKQTVVNNISFIEFYHPSHNSLPGDILHNLVELIKNAGDNDDVRVIVLQSGGDRTFCAGASFTELVTISDEKSGMIFFSGFANVINACRKCPKLIIGRVQGKAVGGGVGLAASFDYTLATKHAAVKLSELAVGIGPFVVGPAVERKIGLSAMSQLAIDATEWQTAEWARAKGLYADIFDTAAEMDAAISTLANKLKNSNPEAMRLLKQVFWRGTDDWDTLLAERAAMSGQLVLSDFTKNAINSFKKK